MSDEIHSEPAAWPALVCAAIAGGAAWYFDYGWLGIPFIAFGGWMSWTLFQWMDMITSRLMRIEQKIDKLEEKK